MRSVPLTQARERFKDIIDAAARGEAVLITRNGKPVAEIRPTAQAEAEYWAKTKPLRIGPRGLGKRLLDEERDRNR